MASPLEVSNDLYDSESLKDPFESEQERPSSDSDDEEQLEEPGWHASPATSTMRPPKRLRTEVDVMKQTIYQPLSPGNFQIRLVLLQPGRGSDRLVCDLFEASLETNPQYEAVSYAWGTSGDSERISLNLESIFITSNLSLALRHLRLPDEERILWVDALCIDQSSLLERSTQVAIMDCIYKFAHNVIVWLGKVEEKHIELLPVMERVLDPSKPSTYNDSVNEVLLGDLPDANLAVEAFLSHTWWYRMWTLQEAVLAQHIEITWGHAVFDDEEVLRVLNSNETRLSRVHRRLIENMALLRDGVSRAKHLPKDPLNREQHSMPATSDTQDDTPGFTIYSNQLHTSLLLVHRHRTRQCADLHDKIYGLLGLGVVEDIIPNYGISVVDLYIDFAVKSIRNTKTLDIFNLLAPRIVPSSMPSWVPDWGQHISEEGVIALENRYVALASNKNEGVQSKSMGSSAQFLKVSGSVLHHVKQVGISYGAYSIKLLAQHNHSLYEVLQDQDQLVAPFATARMAVHDYVPYADGGHIFRALDNLDRRTRLFQAFERELIEAWEQAKSRESFERYIEEAWCDAASQTARTIIKEHSITVNDSIGNSDPVWDLDEHGSTAFFSKWARLLPSYDPAGAAQPIAEWRRAAAEEWNEDSFQRWEAKWLKAVKALKQRFERGDFAVADSGTLLILPPTAHPQDMICSFRGNRSHFVLRFHSAEHAPERPSSRMPEPTRSRGPAERPDYYEIISPCALLKGTPQDTLEEQSIVLG